MDVGPLYNPRTSSSRSKLEVVGGNRVTRIEACRGISVEGLKGNSEPLLAKQRSLSDDMVRVRAWSETPYRVLWPCLAPVYLGYRAGICWHHVVPTRLLFATGPHALGDGRLAAERSQITLSSLEAMRTLSCNKTVAQADTQSGVVLSQYGRV